MWKTSAVVLHPLLGNALIIITVSVNNIRRSGRNLPETLPGKNVVDNVQADLLQVNVQGIHTVEAVNAKVLPGLSLKKNFRIKTIDLVKHYINAAFVADKEEGAALLDHVNLFVFL